jgi:L-fuconolactonase
MSKTAIAGTSVRLSSDWSHGVGDCLATLADRNKHIRDGRMRFRDCIRDLLKGGPWSILATRSGCRAINPKRHMVVYVSLDISGPYRYPNPNTRWLDQYAEEAIEPELPIIDSHHHLWEQDGNIYLLDHLSKDLSTGHNIIATVYVQANYAYRDFGPEELRSLGETERIVRIAEDAKQRGIHTEVCAAIVGFADLMLGDQVAAVLEAHLDTAPERLRGVRHSVSRDPHFPKGIVLRPAPAGRLSHPKFRAGLATLAKYGLTYDAMLYHTQIPELTVAARALPELPIVLDHFGCIIGVGPYRGCERSTFETWRNDIRNLADCPNVTVKLGGMGMVISGATYNDRPLPPSSLELADAWRPYVQTCIEFFGVKRCMFEGNFPVDKAVFSYGILWNAFKWLTSGASVFEKAALFHDTAAAFYRIKTYTENQRTQ